MTKQFFINEKDLSTLRDGTDSIVTICEGYSEIKHFDSNYYSIELEEELALRIYKAKVAEDINGLHCSAKRLIESQIPHEGFRLYLLSFQVGEFYSLPTSADPYSDISVEDILEKVEFFRQVKSNQSSGPGFKVTTYMPCVATYRRRSPCGSETTIGLEYNVDEDEFYLKDFTLEEEINLLMDLDDPAIKGDNVQSALEYLKLCLENN